MASTESSFKICIIGGGIAGLASAITLRGPSRQIVVIEQSRLLKEVGAAISLQPNAHHILSTQLDFDEEIRQYGGLVDNGFQIFRTDGVRQLQIPSKRETNGGHDRVVFHRVDLHEMLKNAAIDPKRAGSPAELRLASRVSDCECEKGIITLEDGTELGPFDLIVGADGIHSKIRDSVLGEKVDGKPTGLSAYRMLVPKDSIKDLPHAYAQCTNEPWTSMLVGHDCRVVMGPCRNGDLLSIVAIVPDKHMHETSTDSWTSSGSLEHLLESYSAFPEWTKTLFGRAPSLGLWQLRDLDPLRTWHRSRVILIGDAAHAMLPTQGQGASQSIEDAEALGAFFKKFSSQPSKEDVEIVLERVYNVRKDRAALIQGYSRQQAAPATNKDTLEVTLNPMEFHKYNVEYKGAIDWEERMEVLKAETVSGA